MTYLENLTGKKYQNIKDINSLDTVIMFCPNEPSISSLGDVSRKMMDYAISKKITLVGPSMLYFALKTVEYFLEEHKNEKLLYFKVAVLLEMNKFATAYHLFERALVNDYENHTMLFSFFNEAKNDQNILELIDA